MRAYDCTDPAHGDMHMSGADDAELTEQIKAHRDQFHEDLSDQKIEEMVAQGAYDE